MNIFAFAIIPVMFSVHTIVSWDFAMATRPGWSSTVFGPYFVLGALHSGMGAVAIVLFIMRSTMKHMNYFIRTEHFDALGKLMLIVSMAWAYFFFNDYIVQWYGGDKWTDILLHWLEERPDGLDVLSRWCSSTSCFRWLTLWNKKVRTTPWLLALIGLLINVGMYFERYIIIPVTLTHQPHAVHLETVRTAHRNFPDHRHLLHVPPVLHDRLTPDPADPGLGGAGRADGAQPAQGG